MSKFKKGQSGNPGGRPRGVTDRRTAYAGLIEQHIPELIEAAIKMAKAGDVQAMRLCIERVIPKAQRPAINVTIPKSMTADEAVSIKAEILQSALEGKGSIDDAERLMSMVDSLTKQTNTAINLEINTTDPIEASRIYQQIMRGGA